MTDRIVLGPEFFQRPAKVVARQLLGKYLVRRDDQGETAAMIHETEAYVGPHDLACHGRVGRTARTEPMFAAGGVWYVYLIYGMYWMLNVVTDGELYPSAVLFRGAQPWTGPGRLTRAMRIDKSLNALPASPTSGLWIEDRGTKIGRGKILATPRIGIDYAGEWKDKPLRFVLQDAAKATKI